VTESSKSEPSNASNKPGRSLVNIATIVAIATLLSKLAGLFRQQAIAAIFGVGPAAGAYSFAYVIPGFLLILLGGINGPFHSAVVSVLAKKDRKEVAPIIESVTTLVVGLLILVTVALVIFADPFMHLVAPGLYLSPDEAAAKGLDALTYADLQQTREIAVAQFKIMAPMAIFAGLIGIGFGTLNAADMYWLPSISPIFSSVAVIGGLGFLALSLGADVVAPGKAMIAGQALAWATLGGAIIQWLIQLPVQWRSGLGTLRPRFNFNRPEVKAVLKVLGPATFSSGMLQINVWTDLFFASFIPNAAAAVSAMSYASLLVQAPLGILSNMILVPFLPIFSKLSSPENWGELKSRIRQSMMMTAVAMLPLGALIIALALPFVRIIYERIEFDLAASVITADILVAYGVGMFVYLGRDVLVRVFYSLGDGDTPFRISIVNIGFNALFDYLLVDRFGAPGLVLATVGVNVISMVAMLWILNRRLNGLGLITWIKPLVGLTVASVIAGLAAWGVWHVTDLRWGSQGIGLLLVNASLATTIGIVIYGAIAMKLNIPEVESFAARIKGKIPFLR
jgi:putative peptidoglycan lipid II flippase